jgi:hypothetical protein
VWTAVETSGAEGAVFLLVLSAFLLFLLVVSSKYFMHGIVLDMYYSLRPILLFTNMDVSTTKMCLDTFILAKSNMGRKEYYSSIIFCLLHIPKKLVFHLLA